VIELGVGNFAFTELTAAKSYYSAGETVSVKVIVKNNGTVKAEPRITITDKADGSKIATWVGLAAEPGNSIEDTFNVGTMPNRGWVLSFALTP